ncbi:MAG: T9SS type A sorting domain-containing protein [Bacteroidia bacterium]|jgi:hypothetical protein
MKKVQLLLFGISLSCAIQAQKSIVPSIVDLPETGLQQLSTQYPYMLFQNADQTQAGNWINAQLNTFILSPVPGYLANRTTRIWENNAWMDSYVQSDSILLDNQSRLGLVYEDALYNYPGFVYRQRLKYAFEYETDNQVRNIDVKSANPPTSTNYSDYARYRYMYDGSGKRIMDSLFYTQAAYPYLVYYYYNPDGKPVQEVWITPDPSADTDSSFQRVYNFDGENLTSTLQLNYDEDAMEWFPQSADTFTYNAQGNIDSRITYGFVSVNGSDFEFAPIRNELYTYNTGGKLIEIIEKDWVDNAWINSRKTTILYDAGDEPVFGFTYDYENGDWNTVASSRILFKATVGIKNVNAEKNLMIYPNPASGKVFIELPDLLVQTATLIDYTGKAFKVDLKSEGETRYSFETAELASGLYWVKVSQGENSYTQKLMIQ